MFVDNKGNPAKLTRIHHEKSSSPLSSLFKLPNPFSKSQSNLNKKENYYSSENESVETKVEKWISKKKSTGNLPDRPKSTFSQPLERSPNKGAIIEKSKKTPLKPLKVSPSTGLSPLDAIKVRAENELRRGQNRRAQSTSPSKPQISKPCIDLAWTKELENINQELNHFEAQIGVDKGKSLAHFCSTTSPTPPFINHNIRTSQGSPPSIDYRLSRGGPTSKTSSPPPNQFVRNTNNRYSNYMPSSNCNNLRLSPQEHNMNIKRSLYHARSQPNFIQPKVTFQNIDRSPNKLSIPSFPSSATSSPSSQSSCSPTYFLSPDGIESLKRELSWERRQRLILESLLREESEKNRSLEEEVRYLKGSIRKDF